LRGFASLIVLLGHAILVRGGMGFDHLMPLMGPYASAAVDVFFVISGFIIATVAMKAADDSVSSRGTIAWNFAVKRFSRIFPVYWVVLALTVALGSYVAYSPPFVERKPLWELVFLTTHINSNIMAAWSLAFEVYFYAVVMIALLISPKRVLWVLSGWSVVSVVLVLYNYYTGERWGNIFQLTFLVFEFIFGMVIAVLIDRKVYRYATSCAIFGLTGLLLGVEAMQLKGWPEHVHMWVHAVYVGIPSAFLVYGIVALEIDKGWRVAPFWTRLGDASYSLYIWHQFLLYTMLKICEKFGLFNFVPGPIMLAFWLGICWIVGFWSYRRIEIPAQNAINGRLTRRRPKLA
jgi:peptidoglycan/LPS O-acetylase OafA/YrhL